MKRRIRVLKELAKEHHENHEILDTVLCLIVFMIIGAIIGFKLTKPINLTNEEINCYNQIAEELLKNTEVKDFPSKVEKYENDFNCSIDFDLAKITVTPTKNSRKEGIIFEISSKGEISSERTVQSANGNRSFWTFVGGYLGVVTYWVGKLLILIMGVLYDIFKRMIKKLKEMYNEKLEEIEAKEKLQLEQYEEEEKTEETE